MFSCKKKNSFKNFVIFEWRYPALFLKWFFSWKKSHIWCFYQNKRSQSNCSYMMQETLLNSILIFLKIQIEIQIAFYFTNCIFNTNCIFRNKHIAKMTIYIWFISKNTKCIFVKMRITKNAICKLHIIKKTNCKLYIVKNAICKLHFLFKQFFWWHASTQLFVWMKTFFCFVP